MQAEQTTPELTAEQQLQLVRDHLLKNIHTKYREFISEFLKLPFAPATFQRAFDHFDNGILWAKEVISYAPFVPKTIAQPVDNVTPLVPEEVKVEVTEEQKTHVCQDSGVEFPVKE